MFKRKDFDFSAELIRHLVTPAFVLGHDGRVLHWNEACERLTGVCANQVVGTTEHWRAFYREPRPVLADLVLGKGSSTGAYAAADFSKDGQARAENWVDLPSGERRYLIIDARALKDPAGRTVAVLETMQDITAEHVARADLAAKEAERAKAAEEQQVVVDDLARRLHDLAEGDLDIVIEAFFPERYKRLRMDFNQAIRGLNSAMTEIRGSSRAVADAADEIAAGADALAKRAEHQAATLEQTAAAHDQITATVRKTLDLSTDAANLAGTARDDASGSRAVVSQTVDAMQSIERSSSQIGQILGVIDEIAFQTNLLALNAGVEAARAGEAGKGFAVVAQEVRALAQRSADAAREIKALIGESTRAVSHGVDLVNLTGETLHRIADQVAVVAERVSEISASAGEQARSLDQVNQAIGALDAATQKNAHEAERTAHACGGLTGEATRLAGLVDRFRTQDEGRKTSGRSSGKPFDLDRAANAHLQWKGKLQRAIDLGETLDVATVSADNCCALGRWLHGDARLRFATNPALGELTRAHAAFHCEAGEVAQAINARRMDRARTMIESGTPFDEKTKAVCQALKALQWSEAKAA